MPTLPTAPTAAPTIPDRSDRANFPTQMFNFNTWRATNSTETYNLADNAYDNAVEAAASAVAADASAGAAAASAVAAATQAVNAGLAANLVGNWSDQVGALNKPASVYHASSFWGLLNNLADVTTSEPGVSADWVKLSSVETGDLLSTLRTPDSTWLACDGSVYSAASYAALAALLPNTAFDTTDAAPTIVNGDTSFAYNGSNMYVARTGKAVNSSPDGVTWTQRFVSESPLYGVTYVNGHFCVPTTFGFYYSYDGITWSFEFINASYGYNEIQYGAGVYVALRVSSANVDTSSTLGGTWTGRAVSNLSSQRRCWFLNSLFLIAGSHASGGVWTSSNGTTWTQRSAGTDVYDLYWNGTTFVAVGAAGSCYSSTNGTAWTSRSAGASDFRRVMYANSLWVAVGVNNNCYTSPDGTTWTQQTIASGQTWMGLAYGNSKWAIASTGNGLMTSSDGVTWTAHPSQWFGNTSSEIAAIPLVYLGSQFLHGDNAGKILTASSASGTWTARRNAKRIGYTGGNTQTLNGPATDGTTLMIPAGKGVLKTTDHITYTYTPISGASNIDGVYRLGGIWLARCYTSGIYTSSDGVTWTNRLSAAVYSLAYNGTNRFVALLSSGTTGYYSADGITWTGTSVTSDNYYDVIYNGAFYARGGTYLSYSADGITWAQNTNVNCNRFIKKINSVVYSSNTSTLKYSVGGMSFRDCDFVYNGITKGNHKDIAYFNGRYVLTCDTPSSQDGGVIWYSDDGRVFYPAVVSITSSDSVGALHEIDGVLYALGYSSLFASTDGKHWRRHPLPVEVTDIGNYLVSFAGKTVLHDAGNISLPVDTTKFSVPLLDAMGSVPTYIRS